MQDSKFETQNTKSSTSIRAELSDEELDGIAGGKGCPSGTVSVCKQSQGKYICACQESL